MELNELVNKTNTGQQIQQRYNTSTGMRSATQSKTVRVTKRDRLDAVRSKDLEQVKGQIDASFKLILQAADNTPVEQIVQQLNQVKLRLDRKIDKEIERQNRNKK